jgi:SAM-dependent methyltransferase
MSDDHYGDAARLEHVRSNWNEFGRRNPISAIDSGLPTQDWDAFFASGERVVSGLLDRVREAGMVPIRGAALDFGCGVGRLTQALAARFERTTGVDVAESMIDRARSFNRFPDRCEYVLNDSPDLSRFGNGSFDFVCSVLVLQHVGPTLAQRYVEELVRVLRPGGVAIFQLPSALLVATSLPNGPDGMPSSYLAEIRLTGPEERQVIQAPDPIALTLTVTNQGSTVWLPGHQIRVGKRWLYADNGRVVEPEDDGTRVALPGAVEAGASVEVVLVAATPSRPGEYLLEVDLVQEGVTWFGDHGSPTLLVECKVVEIEGSALESGGQTAGIVPRREMDGVPRELVSESVAAAGGVVVAALDDHSAGPEWQSYLYVVKKPRRTSDGRRWRWLRRQPASEKVLAPAMSSAGDAPVLQPPPARNSVRRCLR